jgi:DNA replication and repair protein RecF
MRNATLKQDYPDLKRMIDTIDEQMNVHAAFIFEKRKWLREEIFRLLEKNYTILSDNRETVQIDYESRLSEYNYQLLADMSWERDKQSQRSNAGIHKDDFDLRIKDMPAREYGSQGQIKSFIFALHLSKYRILSSQSGFQPILILDDIFDKLDEGRLSRLMEILMQPEFGQILLSDTTRNRVGDFVRRDMVTEIAMQE